MSNQQLFSFIIIILEEIGSEPGIDTIEELVEREVLYTTVCESKFVWYA